LFVYFLVLLRGERGNSLFWREKEKVFILERKREHLPRREKEKNLFYGYDMIEGRRRREKMHLLVCFFKVNK